MNSILIYKNEMHFLQVGKGSTLFRIFLIFIFFDTMFFIPTLQSRGQGGTT